MAWIRLVRPADLESLARLAQQATFGLTTLSSDPKRLRQRIDESEKGESPLLVMVDGQEERVIGTAGLFTHVGSSKRGEPFYAYRLERSVHRSATLGVHNEVDALHLVKLFDGPTELGTLFLHPDYRGGGNGRVLSLSRFLLIARDPSAFDTQVIAELRGVIDDNGYSPFWEGLGRHFFQVDFPIADITSSQDKQFIAELMPTHPIYVPLLPKSAQQVIGNVHPQTQPARRLLESEGFHFSRMVDIFDGGPCVRCDRNAIRTVNQSSRCPVIGQSESGGADHFDSLVATVEGDFRVIGCVAGGTSDGVTLSAEDIARLRVRIGDEVLVAPLKGTAAAYWKSRQQGVSKTT